MLCPRDQTELTVEHHGGIEVDHCPTCNGRWLDHHELEEFESQSANQDERRGMIEYAKRDSELKCPVCGEQMVAFNYRANPLELDTCPNQHGWWLDAGEDGRLRDLTDDRVRGLYRAASAEEAWGEFIRGLGGKGTSDRIKGFFRGRRK